MSCCRLTAVKRPISSRVIDHDVPSCCLRLAMGGCVHARDAAMSASVVLLIPGEMGKGLEEREGRRWGRCTRQTYINKQVLPQAPSPTMTSLRRISAMVATGRLRA